MEQKIKVAVGLAIFFILYVTFGYAIGAHLNNWEKRKDFEETHTKMLLEALNEELEARYNRLSKHLLDDNTIEGVAVLMQPDTAMINHSYRHRMRSKYYEVPVHTVVAGAGNDTLSNANEYRTTIFSLNDPQERTIQGVATPPPNYLLKKILIADALAFPWLLLYAGMLLFMLHIIYRQRKDNRNLRMYVRHTGHQLRSPFSVLQTTLTLLDGEHRFLQLASSNIRKMRRLFDSLEIAAGRDAISLSSSEFDLLPVVEQIADDLRLNPGKKVEFAIDNRLGATGIYADRLHLEEAIYNLADNALKYSGDDVLINIRLFAENNYICIAVCDDGPGIDPRYHTKIFRKFFRIDPSAVVKGLGLGLGYVRAICAAHGGEITLSSSPGKGSEFVIRIPAQVTNG